MSAEVYRRFIDAFNARDLARILECMDPEVEFQSRFAQLGGAQYTGHEGVRGWWEDLDQAWKRLEVEIERATEPEDGQVLSLVTLHGLSHSGIEVHDPVAHETTYRGGRVSRLSYVDRADAERRLRFAARADIAAVSFDCYGTLVDWEGGLGTFLYSIARRDRMQELEPGRAMRERWEQLQFERLVPWRPYRDILEDSLSAWAGERGMRWNELDAEALETVMGAWQPFPDTVPALRRAKATGLPLAIVSNTDRSIIVHTLRQLEVEFDHVVVAEDVKEYKPGLGPFRRALDAIGEPPERVLHVAFGFKYDIGPAQGLGMRTAWVNRHGEQAPGPERPDHEWRDLWGLAELAEQAR